MVETLDEYQKLASQTAVYPRNRDSALMYTALGLASEAGEYAGKVKKLIRDAELTAQIAVFPALIVHHALDGQQRVALYHTQILGLLMVRKHDLKDFI